MVTTRRSLADVASSASARKASPRNTQRAAINPPIVKANPHPATMTTATYNADECEFMAAIEHFKARTGRKFPTHADMLAIIKSLGYSRPVAQSTVSASIGEGR
ncbi:hypothetical protein [Singulisphaera acidiphila]|uniref:Uncharacterized protein n=1 Tax=Singulisphaera acidiphila (strain ATCC BAA-1392 / DSM 18658 / VKM B-2454 / MOB10) TaxID=886293 RepID=L0DAS8_SINAD|nr:hypothetical protein [Singulisphaera acidiphila]AGA26479.1 hypothetical protein Sinac_2146 [Singulisphaera acidiphila DSM 18658]